MQEPAAAIATSLLPGFPDWVLLDTRARLGHCNNATTAEAKTSDLCPIKVSFEVVDPPGLSRCIVQCPDLNTDSRSPPMVIGADGAFLLIRVCFPVRDKRMFPDVFVYRADPRAPSLHLVPRPYPLLLHFKTAVGVLAAGSGDTANQYCSVIIPERPPGRMSYSLQVFRTTTKTMCRGALRSPGWLRTCSGTAAGWGCIGMRPPRCSPLEEARWPGLISGTVS
jgi:hypothetical protein